MSLSRYVEKTIKLSGFFSNVFEETASVFDLTWIGESCVTSVSSIIKMGVVGNLQIEWGYTVLKV
jgi:hypothetical protein